MDLSCSETMNLNDVENDSENQNGYKVEVPVVVVPQSQIQQQQVKSVITKLYFEANVDPTFLKDRCLENLLTSEQRYQTPCFYFDTIQKNHVTPEMRKMVSDWVIEVSLIFYLWNYWRKIQNSKTLTINLCPQYVYCTLIEFQRKDIIP